MIRIFQRQTVARVLALLVLSAGLLNIASAIWAFDPVRLEFLDTLVPGDISNASRTLTLLIGIFLVFLARGLWGRKFRAWMLSTILIMLSLILHIVKGLDVEESFVLLFPLSALLLFRGEFTIQSGGVEFFSGLRKAALILLCLFLYATVGFFALDGQFNRPVTLSEIERDYEYSIVGIGRDALIPKTPRARWFENSLSGVGIVAILVVLGALFAPAVTADAATDKERNIVSALVLSDGANSTSYFALMPDKQYFFSSTERSVLAYKIRRGVALTLGGPIGDDSEFQGLVSEFRARMTRKGLLPVLYNLTEQERETCEHLRMKALKIGEEAILDVKAFSLETPQLKDIRNASERMRREGVSYQWYPLDEAPWTAISDVDALHRQWLASKKIPPLTFSVNFYPFPVESTAFLLAVYSPAHELWGAFSFFPYRQGCGLVLETMLRSEIHAPNGMVEAAIAHAIQIAREKGIEELSLSMAPLNKSTQFPFSSLNHVYKYQSLFAFKKKFQPLWRPKYLAYQRDIDIPKIALALIAVHVEEQSIIGAIRKLIQ